MPRFPGLVELSRELRRRHVFGVAAAYLVASFAALEVADVVLPALGFPDWTLSVAVYVLIAGLPVVVLLAFVYDVTPLGIVKTGPLRPHDTTSPEPIVPERVSPDVGSIAVLPFVNMTGDPELEYFCDGMTEEIINTLVRLPDLRVAARTSTFAFKGRNLDVREAGEQLNVSLVLEGSVRREGELLRISSQLIGTEDGYHVWSDQYEGRLEDIFTVQEDIADAVAHTVTPKLATDTKFPLVSHGTDNQEACHEYLKGRHQWYQRALPKAIEHFSRAIALDPAYAQAHAGLADACSYSGLYGYLPTLDAMQRAQAAAIFAVASRPDLAEAHYSLGVVEFLYRWDMDAARRAFEAAASNNAALAMPHAHLSQVLAASGDAQGADAAATRAIELEPLAPLVHATIGFANVILRRYERAIDACRYALEIDPRSLPAVWVMGTALIQLGRFDPAIRMLEKAVDATQRNNFLLMWLGGAYAQAAQTEEARQILIELESRAATGAPVLPACSAWIHAYLGETDAAFEFLEQAVAQRNPHVSFFFFHQVPGVYGDPRLEALLANTGFDDVLKVWSARIDA